MTRDEATSVIILAGAAKSGKTTVLTSIYESFLKAPYANFLFAGSKTLVAFERRCHSARVASRLQHPQTERTKPTDRIEFLHLRLVSRQEKSTVHNLLLSDISGEKFRALMDSSEAVRSMKILARANVFSLVLDGQKLIEDGLHHSLKADARLLLRSLLEQGALAANCRLQVIFSKWDLIGAIKNKAAIRKTMEDIKQTIRKVVGNSRDLQFFEIAARPESKGISFAYGLPTLLRAWADKLEEPARPRVFLRRNELDIGSHSFFADAVVKELRLNEVCDISRI